MALLFAQGTFAQDNYRLPEYTKFKLKNGLTVYLMEQHEVPLVHVTAVFPAGAVYDNDEKSGLAGITAAALVLGTKNYSKTEIEESMDYVGATIRTGTGKESAFLSASFMKKDQAQIMPILKDVLMYPTFPAEEWEKMQKRKLVELDQMKESPRSVVGNYFNSFFYGDHPYGNAQEGNKASLQGITVQDMESFYKSQYVPAFSAIALVGDFDTKVMKKEMENLFGDWNQAGNVPATLPETKNPDAPGVLLVNKPDARETTFIIGGPGIARNNPDYVAIDVINTILGGRFTSWLNDELRVNSGLTYGAWSRFRPYKKGGSFIISTFTANATTEQAIDLAMETYGRLHEKGVDAVTLSSAKNYIKGQFPPDYETNESLANLLTDMFLYGFDESYINTFSQKVDALDVTKAKEIIDTYFPKENLQFVLVGKADEIGEMAKKYGKVKQVEISDDGF